MTTSSSAFDPSSNDFVAFRSESAQRLNELTGPGGPINKDSRKATAGLYPASDRRRRDFHREIIEMFLADGESVGKDGLAAMVTAGPPGAGKSTKIQDLPDISSYRRLDADKIKDHLLKRAVQDGIFDDFLSEMLPDGRPILPNELAALVHTESAELHNRLIRMSLESKVNVIIEGTLHWPGLVNRYLGWFAAVDYRKLTILDVEVDCHTALAQAEQRWWLGRQGHFAGSSDWPLGGRFTPAVAISSVYPGGVHTSSCNINAINLFMESSKSSLEEVQLIVHAGADEPSTYVCKDGEVIGDAPEPLVLTMLKDLDDDPGVIIVP